MEVSRTHKLNVIAAIKKKIVDFDYFLINFLGYPNAKEFNEYLEILHNRLSKHMAEVSEN